MNADANMETGHAQEGLSYAERVANGGISEEYKKYLMHTMAADMHRMQAKIGEGKRVLQAGKELSVGKAMSGLFKAMSCGLFLYFMGKPPCEEDFKRWFSQLYGDKVALCRFHFAGKGFYQAVVESEMQRELVLNTVVAYKGSLVFTMPWTPSLQPEEILQSHCPVWVEFPSLPYYLWDQLEDIASALGRVLYAPKASQQESKSSKKACILWDRKRVVPEVLQLKLADFSLLVDVSFQVFPDACYKCRNTGHFARDCPGQEAAQKENSKDNSKETSKETPKAKEQAEAPSSSKELVIFDKGKQTATKDQDKVHSDKGQSSEGGWKETQKKGSIPAGKALKGKTLQDLTNKGKKNIKKDARAKGKPLATMLVDKENYFCSTVNLSDD